MALGFNRRAVVSCATAAMLSGCGTSMPLTTAPGEVPQDSIPTTASDRHDHNRSWMAPQAGIRDLVYVSNDGGGNVFLYTYPAGMHVGTLFNLNSPAGLCTDASERVWVVESGSSKILRFPHGERQATASLTNSAAQNLMACAVDPTSGNLAATSLGTLSSAGAVWVYTNASGKPKEYKNTQFAGFYFAAYDNQGNLYVDGIDNKYRFKLAELPAGGASLNVISLNQTVGFPGGLQWDGQYLAVGDRKYQAKNDSAVYQIAISGAQGSVVGTTTLSGSCDVVGFALVSAGQKRRPSTNELVAPDACQNNARLYPYPGGGSSQKTLSGLQYPLAATISYAN